MPADRQPAIPHRNAAQAACARRGSSVPPRCLVRTRHGHHAARCIHASAERRLQARSPRGARAGAGRWPFHACAICAPPGSRFTRR
ncbi:hypothetical protein JJQ59_03705 [Cupriavidus necator]|uniref:Uncharacterized protein n=1 Tax=Cupriavidus necator TaxID=106590 RepID=A0A367PNU0_CUPNE|nr:hypothetical protein [Cupriavidus necator]QQX85075.1 hypothetical protein JJQ59_03705 [Cupriavidus necator]RCJ09243.1 hypothetical protein DDK22_06945 [Cupriavidus necator]